MGPSVVLLLHKQKLLLIHYVTFHTDNTLYITKDMELIVAKTTRKGIKVNLTYLDDIVISSKYFQHQYKYTFSFFHVQYPIPATQNKPADEST